VKQVRYWYEQAVESRLDDAKFFYEEDLKFGFEKRVEEERRVVWIEGLGTLFNKTTRLEKLALVLSQRVPHINKDFLLKSAFLCKADLLTNMVREKEYTSLQGIMGGIYAQATGENELVAQIISEHYLPKTFGDKLPAAREGSILSMADKIDNIVGAFIVNAAPSGSFDPLGLRRQATAIMTICLEKQFFLNLTEIIEFSFEYFNVPENQNLLNTIGTFFKERLNALLLERSIRYDVAKAVLAINTINPFDAYNRAQALTQFRLKSEFEPLVIGQKRVNNILKGIRESFVTKQELLKEEAEQTLYNQAKSIEVQLDETVIRGEYAKGLELLLSLRPAIDSFFDKVLVMTEDGTLKNNRLGLLQFIKSLFRKIADLSEIVIG
jgi:glycyl-tRNA synthetase beta chain